MLNKDKLESILGLKVPNVTIKDVHWRAQDSKADSLLFYKLKDDQKSLDEFKVRIQSTSFGLLIVNRSVPAGVGPACIIPEEKWPEVQKKILDCLYPIPPLKMIAITGTNGKTTTTDLILQVGHLIGKNGLSIGTLGVREYNKTISDFGLTSPPLIDLRKTLYHHGKGKDFCVFEVSSHALVQSRFHGFHFDCAGWLSFSQDHLDYHGNMEEYFSAKMMIINHLAPNKKIFVPKDQVELVKKIEEFYAEVHPAPELDLKLPLFFQTKFNKNNLEVAKAILENVFNVSIPDFYEKLQPPDGRFYIRKFKSSYIIIDFAHTPGALENICRGIKETFPTHRLKILFGCGGDRDRSKRSLMGSIAETWAEEIYLTSDNPRFEDPELIIKEISKGIKNKKCKTITERPLAVEQAFQELQENEVLLLAGKGHEDYIHVKGVKLPYSDIQAVDEFLSRKEND